MPVNGRTCGNDEGDDDVNGRCGRRGKGVSGEGEVGEGEGEGEGKSTLHTFDAIAGGSLMPIRTNSGSPSGYFGSANQVTIATSAWVCV